MWNLASSSRLLTKSSDFEEKGLTLHPVGSYLMHQSTITGVKFCQRFKDFIYTCSQDRYYVNISNLQFMGSKEEWKLFSYCLSHIYLIR